jgi:hypothetical protein
MRKVSPLGLSIAKILAGLLIIEALFFAAGRVVSRGQGIVSPPREIGDWIVSPDSSPVSDFQRGNPDQISVVYLNGDEPAVHVDVAAVQSVDCLRAPHKYLVDIDGRVITYSTQVMKHLNRSAYTISLIFGIEKNMIDVHWLQKPGGLPVPMPNDRIGDTLKTTLLRRPRLYVCDAWVEWRPATNLLDSKALLQRFADAFSDKIKSGG